MYICQQCNKVFPWPEQKQIDANLELGLNNYSLDPGHRSIKLCPYCSSHEVTEAESCKECYTWYAKNSMVELNYGAQQGCPVCTSCYEDKYFVPPKGLREEASE